MYFRPYLNEFLDRMSKRFELVIFTASRQDYADIIINRIDPEGKFISHRLYRQHCVLVESIHTMSKKDHHVKSMSIISNRKKEDLLIIDNLIYSYAFDIDNGILIRPYLYGKHDYELEFLADALSDLKSFMDSRTYIKEKLRFSDLYQFLGY